METKQEKTVRKPYQKPMAEISQLFAPMALAAKSGDPPPVTGCRDGQRSRIRGVWYVCSDGEWIEE